MPLLLSPRMREGFGKAGERSPPGNAIWQANSPACLSEERVKEWDGKNLGTDDKGNGFTGLVDQIRSRTNLVKEAFPIAGGSDA
jgi:hypothetical protein